MCAEKDPITCHRMILIYGNLAGDDVGESPDRVPYGPRCRETVSMGEPFNGYSYKLAAAVMIGLKVEIDSSAKIHREPVVWPINRFLGRAGDSHNRCEKREDILSERWR